MNWRRVLIFLGVLLIAVVLAFPLREITDQLILLPLAYLLWILHLLYISVDQQVWWIGVGVMLFLILVFSLLPEIDFKPKMIRQYQVARGSVESLARTIYKTESGIYFKWLLANRLGKLAHQMLLQREHGKPRSIFSPLAGEGWNVDPAVQHYLETGLQGSFADFPNTHWTTFSPREKTPLDQDIQAVIEFLESKQAD